MVRAGSRRSEKTQHIGPYAAEGDAVCCVPGPLHGGTVRKDPLLPFFGSRMTKRMIFPVNAIIHNIYIHIC